MNNKKNILIVVIIFFSLLLITTGILINNNNNKNNNKNNNDQEDNVALDKILLDLNLDKYLSSVLYPTVDLNINLLDPNYAYFSMYFYTGSSSSKQKAKIVNNEYYISKYSDYIQFYRNVLSNDMMKNIPSGYEIKQYLSLNSETSMYELKDISNISSCDDLGNDNCYVLVNVINEPEGHVEFTHLNRNENIITGNAVKYISYDEKEFKMVAKFEFKYTEKNGKKYASSLKVLSIDDVFTEK